MTPFFSNIAVKDHFLKLTAQLCTIMSSLESKDTTGTSMALSKRQSYINFCDINVNKAVNGFAYLLA